MKQLIKTGMISAALIVSGSAMAVELETEAQ
jgi:hypothetical protein